MSWIGEAARLAGQGDPEGALDALRRMETSLHPAVRSYHALTRGRILDQQGRTEEAEREIIRAATLDPSNMRAHLDLAVMSARRGQLDHARARLERLVAEADPEVRDAAAQILSQLDTLTAENAPSPTLDTTDR